MDKILEALDLAIKCHKGQKRKGTNIPYIKHIIDVYEILRKEHVDDITLMIGILHDVVEDSGVDLDFIRNRFGDYVAYGVEVESEDKNIADYIEMKKEHIDRVVKSPKMVQLVNCADKLANLNDMICDFRELGDDLFKKFRKGREVLNYYQYAIDRYNLKEFNTYKILKHTFEGFIDMIKTFDNKKV